MPVWSIRSWAMSRDINAGQGCAFEGTCELCWSYVMSDKYIEKIERALSSTVTEECTRI